MREVRKQANQQEVIYQGNPTTEEFIKYAELLELINNLQDQVLFFQEQTLAEKRAKNQQMRKTNQKLDQIMNIISEEQ